jgi:hypothetical protein
MDASIVLMNFLTYDACLVKAAAIILPFDIAFWSSDPCSLVFTFFRKLLIF